MRTLKNFHAFDISQKFDIIYSIFYKPSENYKGNFFEKIIGEITKQQRKYSVPLKIRIINQLNDLLSYSDNDIEYATAVFRHIDNTEYKEKHSDSDCFKNLREFWIFISNIFANDPEIKNLIHWDNPGIDQPILQKKALGNDPSMLVKNYSEDITFSFIPEHFSNNDIEDMFPRLRDFKSGEFGEDADLYGETLAEIIGNAPKNYTLIFNQDTIREIRTLLSYTDEEIERTSKAVINLNPTVEIDDPPNWGRFPSLRAFWTAVLDSFENNVAMQNAESAEHSPADITDSAGPGCNATPPAPQS